MQKRTLFFVGALLCLAIAGWSYYLYQKPRSGVKNLAADYTVSAGDLYQAFAGNEAAANTKYVNKILKVAGVVQQVDDQQKDIHVLLESGVADGGVNCNLADAVEKPRIGQQVVVKGKCTGFLMDVNLVDVVLEKN